MPPTPKEETSLMSTETKKKLQDSAIANSPIAVLLGIYLLLQQAGILGTHDPDAIIKEEQRWSEMRGAISDLNYKVETLNKSVVDSQRDFITRDVFVEWLQKTREANPTVILPSPARQ